MREVFYGVISQGVAPCFDYGTNENLLVFGHREVGITEKLYAMTTAEIMKSVGLGCRVFYFQSYGDFDSLCYKIVSEIKEKNPEYQIKRVYCVTQERYLRKKVGILVGRTTTR